MAQIKIKRMVTRGTYGKVKAYFSISLGSLEIEDMKLIDGVNGLFISFPSKKISKEGEEPKYVDIVKLARDSDGKYTTAANDLYGQILEVVKEEYERRGGEALTASTPVEDDDLPF